MASAWVRTAGELRFDLLRALVHPENVASIRVPAKLRFERNGASFLAKEFKELGGLSSAPDGDLDRRSISWCWPIASLLQTISPTVRARLLSLSFLRRKESLLMNY